MAFACSVCEAVFSRKFARDRHARNIHSRVEPVYECSHCLKLFANHGLLKEHRRTHEPTTGFTLNESAFGKNFLSFRKIYATKVHTFEESVQLDRRDIVLLLNYHVLVSRTVKCDITTTVEFIKYDEDGNLGEVYEMSFKTPTRTLHSQADIRKFVRESHNDIQLRIDDFIANGSSWILDEILFTDLRIYKVKPLNGSCGKIALKYVADVAKIPKPARRGKLCFFEAVANYFTGSTRTSVLRAFMHRHIIMDVRSPVAVRTIGQFEEDNADSLDVRINVLYCEEGEVSPLRVSTRPAKHTINLLLYKVVEGGKVVSHYAHITDLGKFLRRQYRCVRAERCLTQDLTVFAPTASVLLCLPN